MYGIECGEMLTCIAEDRRESLEVRFSTETQTREVSRWQIPIKERKETLVEKVSGWTAKKRRQLDEVKWEVCLQVKRLERLWAAGPQQRGLNELKGLGLLSIKLG
jgi:hypothetical protein